MPHIQFRHRCCTPMKILQINVVYGTGSTGKIAAGMYKLIKEKGFEVASAYGRGKLPNEYGINGIRIGNKFDFYQHVLINFFLGKSGFGSKTVTRRFLKWLDKEQPDLIHLYNIHGFYLHVGLLFEYIKQHHIPVIWTLYDCWPFTGQCSHFDYAGCDKWVSGCHHCPIYRSDYPYSLFKDNSKENYRLKKDAFTGVSDLTIIAPSNWMESVIKRSFLGNYPIRMIFNGINVETFCPKKTNSEKFGVPTDTKILLGVANTWESKKGYEFFLRLADDFTPANGYQLVMIGLSDRQCKKINRKYGKKIVTITRTADQNELADWYRCAFAYVNTTLQESLSLTNVEALACGTPVITFHSGGTPETIIDPKLLPSAEISDQNNYTSPCGILVPRANYHLLKKAILDMTAMRTQTPNSFSPDDCRKQSLYFDQRNIFMQHINLYKQILFMS